MLQRYWHKYEYKCPNKKWSKKVCEKGWPAEVLRRCKVQHCTIDTSNPLTVTVPSARFSRMFGVPVCLYTDTCP